MKAKKLPDVPIMFSTDGRPFVSAVAVPTTGMKTGVRYRYTPAKPAKVCVWTERDTIGHDSGCGETTRQEPFSFCPYCRGKIKVKR